MEKCLLHEFAFEQPIVLNDIEQLLLGFISENQTCPAVPGADLDGAAHVEQNSAENRDGSCVDDVSEAFTKDRLGTLYFLGVQVNLINFETFIALPQVFVQEPGLEAKDVIAKGHNQLLLVERVRVALSCCLR